MTLFDFERLWLLWMQHFSPANDELFDYRNNMY